MTSNTKSLNPKNILINSFELLYHDIKPLKFKFQENFSFYFNKSSLSLKDMKINKQNIQEFFETFQLLSV
jgi:hypothetical protein